jgi:hypothetical protein
MNGMTDSSPNPAGISVRTLVLAIGLTAALTGGGAWLWLRPATDRAPATAEHADDLPPGIVELPAEAVKNAGLIVHEATTRRLPTTIDVTGAVTPEDSRVAHIRPSALASA